MHIEIEKVLTCLTLLVCVHGLKAQSANCTKYEWVCHSSECIAFNKFCDGRKDCSDGSDETPQTCGKNTCPRHSFQCSYGACIDSAAHCNGVKDCVDSSDEIFSTCIGTIINKNKDTTIIAKGGMIWTLPSQPSATVWFNKIPGRPNVLQAFDKSGEIRPTPYDARSPKIPAGPTTSTPLTTSCTIGPFHNGTISLQSSSTELKAGAHVDAFTYIEYKCEGRFVLEGPKINICEGGKWSFTEPKCVIYCPPLRGAYTIATQCVVNGVVGTCARKTMHPVGTIINISCNWGYRKPKGDFPEQLLCQSNGEWDKIPTRCDYTCGTLSTSDENEMNTTLLAPWHLAIYYKKTEETWYEEYCAGTSLSPKLAISVAHCFWDSETSTLVDLSDIEIVAGKYYPGYYPERGENSLYLVASDVYIPQAYKDNQSQQDDIALLVIKYRPFLRPQAQSICLDSINDNSERPCYNTIGRIAARGRESDCQLLSYIDVPVVDNTKCTSKDDQIVEKTVMKDQFCVGEVNELCLMDGEAYAVPKLVDGQKIYYLEGVVSRNVSKEGSYAVVISIHKHLSIIQEYLIPEQAEI